MAAYVYVVYVFVYTSSIRKINADKKKHKSIEKKRSE